MRRDNLDYYVVLRFSKMDAFLATSPSRREKFGETVGSWIPQSQYENNINLFRDETPNQRKVRIAVSIALAVWAAYLSWTTNTRVGYTVPTKIVCALFAALFGGVYLIFYYIMRSDCLPK